LSKVFDISDLKNKFFELQKKTFGKGLNSIGFFSPELSSKLAIYFFTKTRFNKVKERSPFSTKGPLKYTLDGQELALYQFGQGKRTLLVHGWEGQASDFFKLIEPLIKSGHEVWAFDGPGHGGSSGNSSNVFEFVDIIGKLNEKFGPFEYGIGHSMGGVALGLASETREFNPQKIVTMGSPNKFENILKAFSSSIGLSKKIEKTLIDQIEKKLGRKLSEVSVEKAVSNSETEFLIVHDSDDKWVPFESAEAIAAQNENSELYKSQGLGHFKILRDEQTISKMMNFFNSDKSLSQG